MHPPLTLSNWVTCCICRTGAPWGEAGVGSALVRTHSQHPHRHSCGATLGWPRGSSSLECFQHQGAGLAGVTGIHLKLEPTQRGTHAQQCAQGRQAPPGNSASWSACPRQTPDLVHRPPSRTGTRSLALRGHSAHAPPLRATPPHTR